MFFTKHNIYAFLFLSFLSLLVLENEASAQQLAFPGAEGFGRHATGGRGGEVYHVTNLDDTGEGSFRDAVSQSNRIVIFDVGGVINISSRIVIHKDIYVAGQTAPGGGITIYGNGIAFNGSSGNSIIRYIRIRMGKNGDYGKDAVAISEGQDYMFDHVSVSWGRDGTFDVNGSGIDNVTLQSCIVAQGINNHNHSTGGLMQSGKWSMIRSLYIDNKTRNPKARGKHEFINSVLYNWRTNGYIMGDTEGLSECSLMGNYFIYGPSSSTDSHITNTTPSFHVYAEDNWVDHNKNGKLDGTLMTDYKTATLVDNPFPYPGVNELLSAQNALNQVIEDVGASLERDAVDELLINQVMSYGTEGQIIDTEDDNGIPGNTGTVENGNPPTDSDQDGMPDNWEIERGLDPNEPDDDGDDDNDGYTNIEEYLSCLVGEGDACDFNPDEDCHGDINGTAYIDECGECVEGNTGLEACVLDCHGDEDGTAYVDDCSVCVEGNSPYLPCTGTLEAEEACSIDGILSEDINEGFSGAGYTNTDNFSGAATTWAFHSTSDQTATFSFRYANGGGSARDGEIMINGEPAGTLYSPPTGAWTSWALISINLDVVQGTNTMEITATTSGGLANIDLIHLSDGLSDAGCIITSTDRSGDTDLQVFPNPTQHHVHWDVEKDWILMNIQGVELESGKGTEIDLSVYPKGMYFVSLGSSMKRVIKE